MQSLKPSILELVAGGIKAVELVTGITKLQAIKRDILVKVSPEEAAMGCFEVSVSVFVFEQEDVMSLISRLVSHGEIIEISYVLPSMPFRSKSFYLPKGTVIEGLSLDKKE